MNRPPHATCVRRRTGCSLSGVVRFDRFGGTLPESTIDAEKLQDCACELAECLYRIDQARDSAAETADIGGVKTAGPVASVSSGSESITYKAADSCYTTAAKTTAAGV